MPTNTEGKGFDLLSPRHSWRLGQSSCPKISPLWRNRPALRWLKQEALGAKGRKAAQGARRLVQSGRASWRSQVSPSVQMAKPDSEALVFPDNTANITVKYGQFDREHTKVHFLPVVISDNGMPSRTGTSTLTVAVCKCNEQGEFTFCEDMAAQVGVSIQAVVAILLCILTITGQCWAGWGEDTVGGRGWKVLGGGEASQEK